MTTDTDLPPHFVILFTASTITQTRLFLGFLSLIVVTVCIIERQGFTGEAVGVVDSSMPHRLHGCRGDGQTAESNHGRLQPHRRLWYYKIVAVVWHRIHEDLTFNK